jgi:hypothetical protein
VPGTHFCAPALVSSAEDDHRRDALPTDHADVLLPLSLCDLGREAADEVAVLVGRIGEALDVRVLLLEGLHRIVGDRELRVRELVRDGFGRVRPAGSRPK